MRTVIGAAAALYGLDKLGVIARLKNTEAEDGAESAENKTTPKKARPEFKKERPVSREKEKAIKIAEAVLETYNSKAVQSRFDTKVMSENFFMAQQFQESRYYSNQESSSKARGVFQVKPIAAIDDLRYLAFLNETTRELPIDRRCVYKGPGDMSFGQADEVTKLFLTNDDYGRAFGKLYSLAIHDPEFDYNTKNPDVFRGKPVKEQRDMLWLCYHDGPGVRFHPEKASKEGIDYVKKNNMHMARIEKLRHEFESAGLPRNSNYAIIKIMRELDGVNDDKKDEVAGNWVKRLAAARKAKKSKTGISELGENEIRELFLKA
ncbi:hypothetical protein A2303_05470 [Candidatus Falkowbacteria bacterium RIFOXYB2_FULL_47_14]|uniref:Uncharacterized protein n=1 Tax=Candidatus Falkowbacteria bacterium RIFOXYA2_FULL_47_19 TaxID=1797994 RepID=A0A1F5SF38_9BACT|nr:MAG: hypothetical protein A2227_06875 [Candidatus Falkowbacteria bacterium RIFOXYA2_FULL_47_19]OGF35299.1 MAG: hypothetical protein A2468_00025 [Candidatus Falkowbacteria bacterium RIFOXYC2_FULL_46_15]OGF43736.1 MAG: hypothetical protein A2303_05470 [Candidatus Falkowbacteria bacterium RIFOXYB2_FULL_47_14]